MSLNKVILIGNVGCDPEIRYFDKNSAVANFPLATSERSFKLADGTVIPERTEWHQISVRNFALVQLAEKWVKKGSSLLVEGKIRTRNYVDKSGVQRYMTQIVVDHLEFYNNGHRPDDATDKEASTNNSNPHQKIEEEPLPSTPF